MTATNLAKSIGLTSASFKPTAGALVIVHWTGEGSGANPTSITIQDTVNDVGEIVWTALPFYSPFGFAMGQSWYGVALTNTQRQVVLTVNGITPGNNQMVVDQLPFTAIRQTAHNEVAFTTTPGCTFGSVPLAGNYVYSVMSELAAQAGTPPTDETNHIVTNYSGSGTETISSASNEVGSAPQTTTWTSLGGDYILVRAIEVSPPPPPPPPTTFHVAAIPMH